MRLNVYSQELLIDNVLLAHLEDENGMPTTELVTKEADTGVVYSGVRLFLRSPEEIHQTLEDDDRSGITFWLPKSDARREVFAQQLEALATYVRVAPPETGLN